MLNYSCLRNKSFFEEFFEGDIIGTGFFHSVLLISMGLSFCDWASRLISIRFFLGRKNWIISCHISLYTWWRDLYLIYFQLSRIVSFRRILFYTRVNKWYNFTISGTIISKKKSIKKFLYHSFIYRNLIETNNRVHKSNETETFSSSPGNRILQSIRTFRESASNRTNTLHQELDCLRETLQIIWFVSRDSSPRKHRFENSSTRVSNLYIGESREIDFIWHYPGIKLKR